MFDKKVILFVLFHAATCFIATVCFILISGGEKFLEYSLPVKALRVGSALFYFTGTAYSFGLSVSRYFAKYVDEVVLWKISVYASPLWLLLSVFLYRDLLRGG